MRPAAPARRCSLPTRKLSQLLVKTRMRHSVALFAILAVVAACLAALAPMLGCCPPLRRIFGEAAGAKEASSKAGSCHAPQAAAAQRPMAAAAAPAADSKAWPTKPPFVVQPPSGQHKSTVIMLHGLVSV